ncbi:uncharacterized protein N7479_003369 [Penicillium vulpinum]|uniref:Uncharacterized protein n=1 Tax=Penicillium vulpinum TaxID=29845 RepID=A0A1V6S454_9EURO|nr:uncharacterized protein N7479_003369 [Penicillium vulpinum]KAJ5963493.1 hypothetical protein N7479_003369 [Penicillium vulpinum]OQE08636.1 hypothetical protein PENVUL_c009G09208 [Penicillium vulpinum]
MPPHRSSLRLRLPPGHVVLKFSLSGIRIEGKKICESLKENSDGNQWIVILGLTPKAIEILDDERCDDLGGISYRFRWEGSTGLIKVIPPGMIHGIVRQNLSSVIGRKLESMGLSWKEWRWIGRATHKPAAPVSKGKQADQAFIPPSRFRGRIRPSGLWPTLVIETGVLESLPRLRLNAREWLTNPGKKVRIVVLIIITKSEITFERWELAPVPVSYPLIDGLCQQNCSIPPPTPAVSVQQVYSAQQVHVSANQVLGAPLVLPFHAVYNRPPQEGEGDILIGKKDLEYITESDIGTHFSF